MFDQLCNKIMYSNAPIATSVDGFMLDAFELKPTGAGGRLWIRDSNHRSIIMMEFPACCGLALGYCLHAQSLAWWKLMDMAELIAAYLRYTEMIITDIHDPSLYVAHGYRSVSSFINRNTDNRVDVYTKRLMTRQDANVKMAEILLAESKKQKHLAAV